MSLRLRTYFDAFEMIDIDCLKLLINKMALTLLLLFSQHYYRSIQTTYTALEIKNGLSEFQNMQCVQLEWTAWDSLKL